jgi:hypothetical protein
MENQNAFIGRKDQPSAEEITHTLGAAAEAWALLLHKHNADFSIQEQCWKSIGIKYGWSLRMILKKRNILYISPRHNSFQVLFILGDRAVQAALESNLPSEIKSELRQAKRYAEGTGIRVNISAPGDLLPVYELTAIKLKY